MEGSYDDFCEDFKTEYGEHLPDEIHEAFEAIASGEKSYQCDDWYFSINIEKIHALQQNIHVSVENEDQSMCFYICIESGIDCGTVYRNYTIGDTDQPTSKEVEVFDCVELEEVYRENNKIKSYFAANKGFIEKTIKERIYDNHVTGGGTSATKKHYRDKLAIFAGIYTVKYKTITVDI